MPGSKQCHFFVVPQKGVWDLFALLPFGFLRFPSWEIMGRHSLREQTPGLHVTTCKSLCCTFHHWAETNLGGLQPPALERCREPRNAIGAVHSLAIFQKPKHNLHSSLTWWALSSHSLLCPVCRKLLPVSLSVYDTIMDTVSIVYSLKKHLKTVQTAVLEWTKNQRLVTGSGYRL